MIRNFFYRMRRYYYTIKVERQCGSQKGLLRVNGKSKVTKNTHLGSNVNFNGMVISGSGNVYIGDNFHSGKECLMITQNHNYDFGEKIPYDNTYITKDINISDNVWIGTRVIILPGVHIGEGAIIQAGSVVVSDIERYSIAGGAPAMIFSQRNIEHYEKLKANLQFW